MDPWKIKVETLVDVGDKIIAHETGAQTALHMMHGQRGENKLTQAVLNDYLSGLVEGLEPKDGAPIKDAVLGFQKKLEERATNIASETVIQGAKLATLTALKDEIAVEIAKTMQAIEAKAAYEALPEEEKASARRPAGAKGPKGKVAAARKARAAKKNDAQG